MFLYLRLIRIEFFFFILIKISLVVFNYGKKLYIVFILVDDLGFNDIGYYNLKFKIKILDELVCIGV